MPKTREFFADGLEFSNAFVTSPVCCPSRASIHSGRYPHNSGIFSGTPPDGGYETFATNGVEDKSVSVRMQAAGYETAFLGKYLNGYEIHPEAVPPGWDEWFGLAGTFLDGFSYEANHNGEMESYGDAVDDYQTDVLSRQAVSFLEQATSDEDEPFLLFLSPSAPHYPIVPAPRHEQHPFVDEELPRPANFDEIDVSDKPEWIRVGTPRLDQSTIDQLTTTYRNGLGALLAVDDMIAAVVAELRDAGELDDTYFFFASDNGYNRGAHRLEHKMVPYEESLRVPLAIVGPGVRHDTEDGFVTNLDFAPTFLDLAGASLPNDLDGRSLRPMFDAAVDDWRTDFAIEFNGTYASRLSLNTLDDVRRLIASGKTVRFSPTYRALRSEKYLYVEWYAGEQHDYELYDMTTDPYEMSNLLSGDGAAEYEATTRELHARLEHLESCAGATCR